MVDQFIQRRSEIQAYAVEAGRSSDHHLYSDHAALKSDMCPSGGTVSERPQFGKATVAGKRVLVGALQFSIRQCGPKEGHMPSILAGTCNGRGVIQATSDSLLQSDGMFAIKEGDEGQCFGIATSSKWPFPLVPVACTVCIGQGKSLQPEANGQVVAFPEANCHRAAHVDAQMDDQQMNHFPIRLQYEDGSPAKGAKWKATGSNGTKLSGRLNENGEWLVRMTDESCTVSFPDFDPSIDASPKAKLSHAFKLVEDLIAAGEQAGLSQAVELLRYWRRGGDDKEGSSRPDHCWIDPFGRARQGKRIGHQVFSGDQIGAVVDRLDRHRERYIKGTVERIADGRMSRNGQVVDMKFEAVSDNWLGWDLLDLQFGFGHCTIFSRVKVRVVDFEKRRFVFDGWEVALSDRYDWEHGKSQLPGVVPLMTALHFARYWRAENPQAVLRAMETPYGFHAADFERVYARPFDLESEFYKLGDHQAPKLFVPFILDT